MNFKMKKIGKKSQLKIQEMSFMLLAVVLFFALVFLFFIIMKMASLKGEAAEFKDRQAISIAENIVKIPEFSCPGELCIDTDKVMAVKGKLEQYYNFFPVNKIEIIRLYPRTGNVECNIGTYPDCDFYSVIDKEGNYTERSSYVALCRMENQEYRCEMGEILIG